MSKNLPEPMTSELVRCPGCSHGIDPHGVNPGGPCGVGNERAEPCACLLSPDDIAAWIVARQDGSIGAAVGTAVAAVLGVALVVLALGGLVWVVRWTLGWAL